MIRLYPPERAGPLPSPYADLELPEPPPGRPFIYVNMAMTLDGRVVVGNPKAGSTLSGTEGDRRGMAELRAAADAVMIGAGTVRAENPLLRIRDADLRERRRTEGRPENPRPIVVTGSGTLDPDARLFGEPGVMVVTGTEGARRLSVEFRNSVELLVAGERELDLHEAALRLRNDFGIDFLLVEGGPTLAHAFLKAGLVDELFLTLAPIIKAGKEIPTLIEGAAFPYDALPRFRLLSLAEEGGELYLRYAVSDRSGAK